MLPLIGVMVILGVVNSQVPGFKLGFNFGKRVDFNVDDITGLPVSKEHSKQIASINQSVKAHEKHIANAPNVTVELGKLEERLKMYAQKVKFYSTDGKFNDVNSNIRKVNQEIDELRKDIDGLLYPGVAGAMLSDVSLSGPVLLEATTSADIAVTTSDFIKFDNVTFNSGNGYDVTTGTFTAPRAGRYVFDVVVLSSVNSDFDLLVDGVAVSGVKVTKTMYLYTSWYGKAEMSLLTGQVVAVRARQSGVILAASRFNAKLVN